MAKEKDKSLKWCYIGENKEYVMMTCTREDWETICKALELIKNGRVIPLASESDEWNYGYTRRN